MRARLKPLLGFLIAFIFGWAAWVGLTRGGQDFRVFHYAGKLVLEGRWDALYQEGPDRYLYAPGFALLIAPFAALPEQPALFLWLALTLAAFAAAMRALSKRVGFVPVAFALLFSIRPIAIDLRYGQVNLFILSAAVWALLAWSERAETRASRRNLAFAWFVFAIAAFAKIYPLALFIFPLTALFWNLPANRRLAFTVLGAAAIGAGLLILTPSFVVGIYPQWLDALARKGLPTDTHNQSLLATLTRVFGGESFYSLGMGGLPLRFPGAGLSLAITRGIWIGFSGVCLAALAWLATRKEADPARARMIGWLGLAICFLPAHLIWKSYFVLGIPLLAALFAETATPLFIVLGLFLALTSGDFVGARAAGWIEAVSPFFWIHLIAVITGFSRLRAPKVSS